MFSLYIGTGIPLPIVILPNQAPTFLKFCNFLSLTLLPFSVNQLYNILYVMFNIGFSALGIFYINFINASIPLF
jgi:hypothetical protein